MKNLYLLHLIIFILFSNASSFCQCWEEINLNADQQLIPNGDLYKIHFFNDSVGLIFGQFYNLKTINGGDSWFVTHQENVAPANYQFITDSIGYYATHSDLYKTNDGGNSWERISNFFLTDSIRSVVKDIYFINEFEGFAVGNEKMLIKTLDGGNSWEKIFTYSINMSAPWDIDFIDSQYGFASCSCNRNIFYKTKDFGKTWISFRNNLNEPGIAKFEMIDTSIGIGIIGGNGGKIGRTENGWKTYALDSINYFPVNLFKTSTNRIWMASYLGIYKTENLGRTWESTYFGDYVRDINFSSPSNGWAVGDNYLLLKYNPGIPDCVNTLYTPRNGNTNVSINPNLSWSSVNSGCLEGYFVSMGTSVDSMDILYKYFVGLDTTFTPEFELNYDTDIFLKIESFNTVTQPVGCEIYQFHTEKCDDPIITNVDIEIKKGEEFLGGTWFRDTILQINLKSKNNCDSIIYYNIMIDKSNSLYEFLNINKLVVFPNPFKNYFTLSGKFDLPTSYKIELRNIDNTLLYEFSKEIPKHEFLETIETDHLNSGIYILILKTRTETMTRKLILSR